MTAYQFDGFPGFNEPTFTLTPDILFDELAPDLAECELRVLLYIVRRTFGFKKSADTISINQMVDGIKTRDGRVLDRGTGMSRPSVVKGAKGLAEKGIIVATANRNPDGGDAPTTYQLRFRTVDISGGGELTKLTPPSKAALPPGVNLLNPQDTVIQDTVEQGTEGDSSLLSDLFTGSDSNIRNVAKGTEKRGDGKASDATQTLDGQNNPIGETTPAAARTGQHLQDQAPAYSRERQVILGYLHDFSFELGDKAPLRSTVTRAYNLLQQSGVGLDQFIAALYEARSVTKERTSAIHGTPGVKNKMPYFFGVLEDVLGLQEDTEEPDETPQGTRDESKPRDIKRDSSSKLQETRRPWTHDERPTVGGPYVRVSDGRPTAHSHVPDPTSDDSPDAPAPRSSVQQGSRPVPRRSGLGPYKPAVSRRSQADGTPEDAPDAPESRNSARNELRRPRTHP